MSSQSSTLPFEFSNCCKECGEENHNRRQKTDDPWGFFQASAGPRPRTLVLARSRAVVFRRSRSVRNPSPSAAWLSPGLARGIAGAARHIPHTWSGSAWACRSSHGRGLVPWRGPLLTGFAPMEFLPVRPFAPDPVILPAGLALLFGGSRGYAG